MPPETLEALKKRGHVVKSDGDSTGKVYGVFRKDDGTLDAAFDSRGEGAAGGGGGHLLVSDDEFG